MAKLKAFIARLEDIADEAIRELYVPDTTKDGTPRFKLDADGLEDVTGLKSTITALRAEIRQVKERAEPLADLADGEDPAAIIAAGKEALEARRTGKETSAIESVKQQMNNAHAKELKKLQDRIAAQQESLEEVMIENEVRAVAADPEIKGNATLLMPHIKAQAKVAEVTDDSGKIRYAPRVLGADRKERVDASGNPISIRALVAELREKEEYSGAFLGSGASGSGTPPDGGSGMPTPPRTPTGPKPDAKAAKRSSNDYGAI